MPPAASATSSIGAYSESWRGSPDSVSLRGCASSAAARARRTAHSCHSLRSEAVATAGSSSMSRGVAASTASVLRLLRLGDELDELRRRPCKKTDTQLTHDTKGSAGMWQGDMPRVTCAAMRSRLSSMSATASWRSEWFDRRERTLERSSPSLEADIACPREFCDANSGRRRVPAPCCVVGGGVGGGSRSTIFGSFQLADVSLGIPSLFFKINQLNQIPSGYSLSLFFSGQACRSRHWVLGGPSH